MSTPVAYRQVAQSPDYAEESGNRHKQKLTWALVGSVGVLLLVCLGGILEALVIPSSTSVTNTPQAMNQSLVDEITSDTAQLVNVSIALNSTQLAVLQARVIALNSTLTEELESTATDLYARLASVNQTLVFKLLSLTADVYEGMSQSNTSLTSSVNETSIRLSMLQHQISVLVATLNASLVQQDHLQAQINDNSVSIVSNSTSLTNSVADKINSLNTSLTQQLHALDTYFSQNLAETNFDLQSTSDTFNTMIGFINQEIAVIQRNLYADQNATAGNETALWQSYYNTSFALELMNITLQRDIWVSVNALNLTLLQQIHDNYYTMINADASQVSQTDALRQLVIASNTSTWATLNALSDTGDTRYSTLLAAINALGSTVTDNDNTLTSALAALLTTVNSNNATTWVALQSLTQTVGTNSANIAANTATIVTNNANIASNTAGVASNTASIASNTASISNNAAAIAANTISINQNTGDISANTAAITANMADIYALQTQSTVNTVTISNNNASIWAYAVAQAALSKANNISIWDYATSLSNKVDANQATTNAAITTLTNTVSSNLADTNTAISVLDGKITGNNNTVWNYINLLSQNVATNTITLMQAINADNATSLAAINALSNVVNANYNALNSATLTLTGIVNSDNASIWNFVQPFQTSTNSQLAILTITVSGNNASIWAYTQNLAAIVNSNNASAWAYMQALAATSSSNYATVTSSVTALTGVVNSNNASLWAYVLPVSALATSTSATLSTLIVTVTANNASIWVYAQGLNAAIIANTANIATNTANIASNTATIGTHTTNIATLTSNVATNTANIATNTANIATLTTNVAANTAAITSNNDAIWANAVAQAAIVNSNNISIWNYATALSATTTSGLASANAAISTLSGKVTSNNDSIWNYVTLLAQNVNTNTITLTQAINADNATSLAAINALSTVVNSNYNTLNSAILTLSLTVNSNNASIWAFVLAEQTFTNSQLTALTLTINGNNASIWAYAQALSTVVNNNNASTWAYILNAAATSASNYGTVTSSVTALTAVVNANNASTWSYILPVSALATSTSNTLSSLIVTVTGNNASIWAYVQSTNAVTTANIASNTANIAANTASITTNTANIASNAANIATLTTNLATDVANVAALTITVTNNNNTLTTSINTLTSNLNTLSNTVSALSQNVVASNTSIWNKINSLPTTTYTTINTATSTFVSQTTYPPTNPITSYMSSTTIAATGGAPTNIISVTATTPAYGSAWTILGHFGISATAGGVATISAALSWTTTTGNGLFGGNSFSVASANLYAGTAGGGYCDCAIPPSTLVTIALQTDSNTGTYTVRSASQAVGFLTDYTFFDYQFVSLNNTYNPNAPIPSLTVNGPVAVTGTLTVNGVAVTGGGGGGTTTVSGTSAIAGFQSYADVKASGVGGGASTASQWTARVLNTIQPGGGLDGNLTSLATGTGLFTIQAGIYIISASAPASQSGLHMIRLYDVTAGGTVANGSSEWSNNGQTRSTLTQQVTLSSPHVYRIDHWVGISRGATVGTNDGFGEPSNNGSPETYTVVTITTVASNYLAGVSIGQVSLTSQTIYPDPSPVTTTLASPVSVPSNAVPTTIITVTATTPSYGTTWAVRSHYGMFWIASATGNTISSAVAYSYGATSGTFATGGGIIYGDSGATGSGVCGCAIPANTAVTLTLALSANSALTVTTTAQASLASQPANYRTFLDYQFVSLGNSVGAVTQQTAAIANYTTLVVDRLNVTGAVSAPNAMGSITVNSQMYYPNPPPGIVFLSANSPSLTTTLTSYLTATFTTPAYGTTWTILGHYGFIASVATSTYTWYATLYYSYAGGSGYFAATSGANTGNFGGASGGFCNCTIPANTVVTLSLQMVSNGGIVIYPSGTNYAPAGGTAAEKTFVDYELHNTNTALTTSSSVYTAVAANYSTLAVTGKVTSAANTLDDGLGNMAVTGTLSVPASPTITNLAAIYKQMTGTIASSAGSTMVMNNFDSTWTACVSTSGVCVPSRGVYVVIAALGGTGISGGSGSYIDYFITIGGSSVMWTRTNAYGFNGYSLTMQTSHVVVITSPSTQYIGTLVNLAITAGSVNTPTITIAKIAGL